MSEDHRRGRRISTSHVHAFLRENWLLLFILCLGVGLRSYAFGSVPPGLNQDEAAAGYDAFALLHHGIDRNGFHNPVLLVSWGSGMNALPSYLMMPFLLLFDLSPPAVRGVNLVAGIASLPVFYLLVRRTGDKLLALLATFLLAISPWHIMASRWALEANLMPALFLCGVYFLARARDTERSLLWAAIFFGLTLYAYGTAYLATPLFLALALLVFYWHRPRSWRPLVQAALAFVLIAIPIGLTLVINQFKLNSIETSLLSMPRLPSVPRYQTISTLFGEGGFSELWDNVNTFGRLLVSGNDGLIWNAIPHFPYLYYLGLPLAVLGLVATVPRRRFWLSQTHFFFVAWLAASIVVAVSETVNINRTNIIFLPLTYFAAVGIRALASSRVILGAVVGFYLISLLFFTNEYFGSYRSDASAAFYPKFGEAIDKAASGTPGPICVTGRVNQPYIFVLFYRKLDPHVFVQTVQYKNPGAEFQNVLSFDRFTFGLERCDPGITQGYVADQGEENLIDDTRFSTERVGRYVVGLRR